MRGLVGFIFDCVLRNYPTETTHRSRSRCAAPEQRNQNNISSTSLATAFGYTRTHTYNEYTHIHSTARILRNLPQTRKKTRSVEELLWGASRFVRWGCGVEIERDRDARGYRRQRRTSARECVACARAPTRVGINRTQCPIGREPNRTTNSVQRTRPETLCCSAASFSPAGHPAHARIRRRRRRRRERAADSINMSHRKGFMYLWLPAVLQMLVGLLMLMLSVKGKQIEFDALLSITMGTSLSKHTFASTGSSEIIPLEANRNRVVHISVFRNL